MNVMSLASIGYGTGEASLTKSSRDPQVLSDAERDLGPLQQRAADRAGGVVGDLSAAPAAAGAKMPAYVAASSASGSKKKSGPQLCLVKMLDGTTLQLYAEPTTLGGHFLDQVCSMLNVHEKYYFGLAFLDHKGDEDWLQKDKKVLKHDWPKKADPLELEFRLLYYPLDVTMVLQYATLYQAFLAAKTDVVRGRLDRLVPKDAVLLAALAFQAQRGDYSPALHPTASLASENFIPNRCMGDFKIPPTVTAGSLG
jgi:hypothetical protein